ncbi:unnamed protein product [Didymodactylos carnosus]|uniref:Uncharacterized protein n=1 Tax=Didymodactylos carnosus TaxID=1234261 RepID=A0A815J661_9BILA|nr:unnamed protein product [Didymodactylos carnosus]CAF1375011.1 unnamed protein product [Didymodactylos carnosus]CAF4031743.1 unnamed protein product [Didymodactylos carnosus]CAF4264671.1 unnamed protein product [Didymodactylos carnosus]
MESSTPNQITTDSSAHCSFGKCIPLSEFNFNSNDEGFINDLGEYEALDAERTINQIRSTIAEEESISLNTNEFTEVYVSNTEGLQGHDSLELLTTLQIQPLHETLVMINVSESTKETQSQATEMETAQEYVLEVPSLEDTMPNELLAVNNHVPQIPHDESSETLLFLNIDYSGVSPTAIQEEDSDELSPDTQPSQSEIELNHAERVGEVVGTNETSKDQLGATKQRRQKLPTEENRNDLINFPRKRAHSASEILPLTNIIKRNRPTVC